MASSSQPAALPQIRHRGPSLLLLAIVYTVLMAVGGSTLNAAFRIPHESAAAIAFVANISRSLRLGSFCEFGSAVPLGIFVATVVSRLRFLRVRAAGEMIALVGGIAAMSMLLLSSLALWSLTRPGVASVDGAVRTLQALGFAGGGPGFVVPLGLFIAGVSVTAGLYRLIPRWLMILGLVVAVASELASLTLLFASAGYFIPVGRFISIVWMIGVAVTLPSTMPAHRGSETIAQPA